MKLTLTRELTADELQGDTLAQHLRHCTTFTHYITDGDLHVWVGTRPGWDTSVTITAHWPYEVMTMHQLLKGKRVDDLGRLRYSDRVRSYGEVRWIPGQQQRVREAETLERSQERRGA